MNKDITFEIGPYGSDTSTFSLLYGGKKIFNCTIYKEDITEIKAAVLAVQVEMLKDALKTTTVVINNATIVAQ